MPEQTQFRGDNERELDEASRRGAKRLHRVSLTLAGPFIILGRLLGDKLLILAWITAFLDTKSVLTKSCF